MGDAEWVSGEEKGTGYNEENWEEIEVAKVKTVVHLSGQLHRNLKPPFIPSFPEISPHMSNQARSFQILISPPIFRFILSEVNQKSFASLQGWFGLDGE